MEKGSTLRIRVYHLTDQLRSPIYYCNSPLPKDKIPVYDEKFTEMPSNEISVLADCIKFDLTTKETNGSRFGFMVLLKVLPLQAEDMKCEDKSPYELTVDEPHGVFQAVNIDAITYSVGEFICVTCNISNSCSILITVAIICNKTQVEICASASQFMINGREWEWNNYTKLELLGENAILTQELLVNSTLIYLHLNEVIPGDNKAISFRAIDAGIDDAMSKATFMLVPGYGRNIDDSRLGFIFPAQNRNSWISIAGTVNTRDSHVLESFRNGRRGAGCEYEFVSGAPTLTKKYPKRLLGTFRDEDRFVPQFLTSTLYSFHVPAGCSPKVEMHYYTKFKFIKYMIGQTRQQELCSGETLITSQGYQNAWECPRNNFDASSGTMTRNITCYRFLVQVDVEIISIGPANLKLQFFTDSGEDQHFHFDGVTPLPRKFSISDVRGVSVDWEKYVAFDAGYKIVLFMSLKVQRSQIFQEVTITPVTKVSLPQPYVFVFIFVLFEVCICMKKLKFF